MAATTHRWRFTRSGGFDQARLDLAADLKHLDQLDQKLWAALACPVHGLEFDEKTLALIDTEGDGRVRAPEVIAAVAWADEHLKDVGAIIEGRASLPLASISDRTESGKIVLASARHILKDLGKADAAEITLDDVGDTARIFAQTRFNGDGVVPADATADSAVSKVIEEVIACLGPVADRSGKPGVDQAKVDLFFAQLAAHSEWMAKAEADAALRPLGDATGAAVCAWQAVRAKVDDWFTRCRLAEFDPRALAAVNRKEEEYLAVAAKDMSISASEVAGFPLARIDASRSLPLDAGVNPAWTGAMAALRDAVVAPLLGKDRKSVTASEWSAICDKLSPHAAWAAAKPAGSVESLGVVRIREILAGPAKAEVAKLIETDKALVREVEAIAQVERLIRYHRDLYRLLCNFVNFSDFYSSDSSAIFQAGTLYLDARSCELCVRVADPGKHAALAGLAKAFLAYCDCTRKSGEKMTIAAAFTGGDSDFLMAGRNGVFYDRQGRDWDATITKVVENPISIRQAFWFPYKKLVRMIEEQVAKRAAAADAEAEAKLAAAAQAAAHADKPPEKPPEPKKIDVGTVAAIAVAIGAIGTMLTGLVGYATGLFQLPFWKVCLAVVGLMLLVSGPSMLIAWLKLRQRNLAPILDANGWAVNGRVKMNVRFGGSLTAVAALPPGALPGGVDPYGERRSPWPRLLGFAVVVCFVFSFLNDHGWIREWTKEGTWFHDTFHFSLCGLPEEQRAAARAKADAEEKAAQTTPATK